MSATAKYPKTGYRGTGRRKCAIAQVRLLSGGKGLVRINGKSMTEYLSNRPSLHKTALLPLEVANLADKFTVVVRARGGGLSGQADAIQLGVARALLAYQESLREALKPAGLLTRDARIKERKKYGRKRARKRFQFSKR
ncbi:MAG: 30S ribosomal protein S9 [Vampirovibrionales bacterium]|nr:30S ribosomal protein S9 [Vampirovibrionales bacterium]